MAKYRLETGIFLLVHICGAGCVAAPAMAGVQEAPAIGRVSSDRTTAPIVVSRNKATMTAGGHILEAGFPAAEFPLSDGGIWHHLGQFWTQVRTVESRAVGTQTGADGYDDSYAYLEGFGPDQTIQATISADPAMTGDYQEVELLLRWADSPTSARGYECNLAWNGAYAQIVRWNGPFGNFTYIASRTAFEPGIMPPRTGDVLTATIRGSRIHVYLNKNDGKGDRPIVTARDRIFSDGNPGLGFYVQGKRDPIQFGFTQYRAFSR